MEYCYLLSAILLITIGHIVRVKRWGFLMTGSRKDNTSIYGFFALSAGYIINVFIPFRFGELVRITIFNYLDKRSFWVVAFSVFIERILDFIIICLIFSLFRIFSINLLSLLIVILSTIFLIFGIGLVHKNKRITNIVFLISSIFNFTISNYIFHMCWCLQECFNCLFKNRYKVIFHSLAMWSAYLTSCYLLALSLQGNLREVLLNIFRNPFHSSILSATQFYTVSDFIKVLIYFISPLILMIGYVFLKNRTGISLSSLSGLFRLDETQEKQKSFSSPDQYYRFLRADFNPAEGSNILQVFYNFGLTYNAVLARLFHGGSNALTALVKYDGKKYVRKFAMGDGVKKLELQRKWLNDYQSVLPLCELGNYSKNNNFYLYDMPYEEGVIDFYQYIHCSNSPGSWDIICQVLEKIGSFHQANIESGDKSFLYLGEYVDEKVIKNFNIIYQEAAMVFTQDVIKINDKKIDLVKIRSWIENLDKNTFFENDGYVTKIHGDLTIENIIISPQSQLGWYLIDPNSENIFNSPLLDYAKLMQSLHLGYERLNRGIDYYLVSDSEFIIPIEKSYQYEELYNLYVKWITQNLGCGGLKSIYLHEIIHYLRLIPYKFNVSSQLGNAFTLCLLLLIVEYLEKYNDN